MRILAFDEFIEAHPAYARAYRQLAASDAVLALFGQDHAYVDAGGFERIC